MAAAAAATAAAAAAASDAAAESSARIASAKDRLIKSVKSTALRIGALRSFGAGSEQNKVTHTNIRPLSCLQLAMRQVETAIAMEPLHPAPHAALAVLLLTAERAREALDEINLVLTRDWVEERRGGNGTRTKKVFRTGTRCRCQCVGQVRVVGVSV